jgi:hypothetical protein
MSQRAAQLWAGAIAPVAFVAVFVIEGALRPGYDPARHFVSLLALTDRGWIQIANFVVAGAALAWFGLGLREAWADTGRGRWVPRLVAVAGIALIWCGVFVGDPALGYPPGTPPGIPTDASWHAALHYTGVMVLLIALPAGMFIAARHGPTKPTRVWATYSIASGIVLLVGWIGSFVIVGPSGVVETAGLSQRIAVVAGWQWLTGLAVTQLVRRRRDAATRQLAVA